MHQICNAIVQWLNEPHPQDPHWSPETWETFKFVCRVHGAAPLLHEKLSGFSWIDPDLKQWLAQQLTFNTQRVARMQAELQSILALFAQHNIPLMPLKGAILSTQFYEAAGWRPMADLDLLIQPHHFARSADLLEQLGYERDIAHWKHTEFIKPDNRKVVSREVEHPDNPRGLELHLYCRESFGGPTINLTELMWRNSTAGLLLGERTTLPKLEALWIHLLVHTGYHLWQGKGRLIHLVDLARLTPHLTEPLIYLNAIEARFTYPSLIMLNKYFPAILDKNLLNSQKARVSTSFQRWTETLNLLNTSYLNPNPAGLYLFKALKFTEGRPREVGQALRFALLPNLEEITLDHPYLATSKAPWLAYLLLPVDWLKRLIRTP